MGWYVIGALVLIVALGYVSYLDGIQEPKKREEKKGNEWTAYRTVAWTFIAIGGGLLAYGAAVAPYWVSLLLWFIGVTVDWKASNAGLMVRLNRSEESVNQMCSVEQ